MPALPKRYHWLPTAPGDLILTLGAGNVSQIAATVLRTLEERELANQAASRCRLSGPCHPEGSNGSEGWKAH